MFLTEQLQTKYKFWDIPIDEIEKDVWFSILSSYDYCRDLFAVATVAMDVEQMATIVCYCPARHSSQPGLN